VAHAFRPKGARIVGRMDPDELAIVIHLLTLTRDFVAPEHEGTGDPFLDLIAGLGESDPDPTEPSDPALRRLLPPAHRTDAEQAAEFRRLTEHTLRQRKAATLSTAIAALESAEPPKVSLDADQARALSVALTDVRLILGERLGLRTDEDADRVHGILERALAGEEDVDPALAQQIAYYDFLTWLQESVTLALLR
jgi:hypothetical protein